MLHENERIEKSLREMGFEEFTDIQTKCIPLIKEGKDIIGHSQTGTGKTAAFALPILDDIDFNSRDIQALVLCPTRELAVQVRTEINRIGKYLPELKSVCVYGGEPISKQIHKLKRKPQIIVGTPGRTIDHIGRKLIRLEKIKYLVLDEADEMLKMGFKEDIETILESTNQDRQTVLFSATMPKAIVSISKRYMKDPQLVSVVSGEETNTDVTQYYYNVKDKNKVEAVARLLHVYNPKLTLIFCNTKRKVDDVTRELTKKGYNVDKIHGDLQQTNRMDVLAKFHSGVLDMVVATDVAARGLDIKNVEAVINYDVPEKPDYYVHRIGRTGRIGNKGYSFTLVSRKEMYRIDQILRFTKANIKKRNIPTPEKVIKVKQEKQYEDIIAVIENENLDSQYDLAHKLLISKDPVEVVTALLSKLEKDDQSEVVLGDINEKESAPNQQGNKQGRKQDNQVRFHINLGSKIGMSPKSLGEFVSKRTKLRNSQIKDITIRTAFSFFTVGNQYENQVIRTLAGSSYSGKTIVLEKARDKDSRKKRR
jgi:ATP-dependent RNA helicase DeaD